MFYNLHGHFMEKRGEGNDASFTWKKVKFEYNKDLYKSRVVKYLL
jgi:hypothetical protein